MHKQKTTVAVAGATPIPTNPKDYLMLAGAAALAGLMQILQDEGLHQGDLQLYVNGVAMEQTIEELIFSMKQSVGQPAGATA